MCRKLNEIADGLRRKLENTESELFQCAGELENAEASLMVKTKENVALVESVRRLREELARTREGSQKQLKSLEQSLKDEREHAHDLKTKLLALEMENKELA